MENLSDIEKRLQAINKKASNFDFTQEFVDAQELLNERRILSEKISRIKWERLSLEEKILKRKEDLSITFSYFQKFKEEVEKKYLFKKNYVRLVDIIEPDSPLLDLLLKSLNTSMYVDFSHKDSNTQFIIEKLNQTQSSEIISLYREVVNYQLLV
ncbi:MAG: hypothetical protein ACWA41_05800 [Putridiphycobacter sp.]